MNHQDLRSDSDFSRYSRQMPLPGFGVDGQKKLEAAAVAIVGCGALGSMQAEFLARAGVGTLLLVDRDVLELHNLQRQLLYSEKDVERRLPKAVAAARRIGQVNGRVRVKALPVDVRAANVLEVLSGADIVLDGTDNLETRYLLNDAAIRMNVPWVYGGVLGFDGAVMFIPAGGKPCLRCLFPEPPAPGFLPTCETAGVLNTAVAWTASLQVTLALKFLVGQPVEARYWNLNVFDGNVQSLSVPNQGCACCRDHDFRYLSGLQEAECMSLCGSNAVSWVPKKPVRPDFAAMEKTLASLGTVRNTGHLLEFCTSDFRMMMFPDGRVLVMGTTDASRARAWISRYLGC